MEYSDPHSRISWTPASPAIASKYRSLQGSLKGTDEELAGLRTVVAESSSSATSVDNPKLRLIIALRLRYDQANKTEGVEEAIALSRELIGEHSVDPICELQLIASFELAMLLARLQDSDCLDEIIEIRCRILATELSALVFDEGERLYLIFILAYNFKLRHERTHRREDIDEAVTLARRAVQLTGPSNSDSQTFLGYILVLRHDYYQNPQDIEDSIAACREAISPFTPSTNIRPLAYKVLGNGYRARFGYSRERKDIDNCIDALRNAVEIAIQDESDCANCVNLFIELEFSYVLRYFEYFAAADIQLAVENYHQALECCNPLHPDYLSRLLNLSKSISILSDATLEPKHIDETISLLQKVQSSTPLSSPLLYDVRVELCSKYVDRFVQYGDEADILAASKIYEGARQSQTHRDELCTILILRLDDFFYQFADKDGAVEDVKSAIVFQRSLIETMRREGGNQTLFQVAIYRLGAILETQCRYLNDSTDINESIQLLEEAAEKRIKLVHIGCLLKLGSAYSTKYSWTKNEDDFDNSIRYYRAASELSDDGPILLNQNTKLGYLLLKKYLGTGREEFRTDALRHLKFASNMDSASGHNSLGLLAKVGEMEVEIGDMESAFHTYKRAVERLPRVAWIGYSAPFQLGRLSYSSAFRFLVNNSAAVSILLAEQTPEKEQHYLAEAVCLLDQGRSVIWSQASSLWAETENLRKTNRELAEKLERCAQFLRAGNFNVTGSVDETQAQRRRREAERFEELVDAVRQLEGFERFLLPLSVTEIQKAAYEGPVVVVNASQIRCDAIVVESGKPLKLIPLTQLTLEKTTELTKEFADKVAALEKGLPAPMQSLMNEIWTLIGYPILEALGLSNHRQSPLPRVWWCPTGELTFLPIHACFPEEPKLKMRRKQPPKPRGMMDLVVSSYTPTISSLLRAQTQQKKAASLGGRDDSPNTILIVAQSEEVPEGAALPHVKSEVNTLRDLISTRGQLQPTVLENKDATTETVPTHIERCSWAHFSCHAVQDRTGQSTQSGFLMIDGRLTLERLTNIRTSRTQFAYLSACESGKGDERLPNESVHIAAGMQFVGFPSVVGTMWVIRDDYATFVAEKFYGCVYEGQEDTVDVGRALHSAIQELRKKEVPVSQWVQFIHIGVGKVKRCKLAVDVATKPLATVVSLGEAEGDK